jgi:hypothetical protein
MVSYEVVFQQKRRADMEENFMEESVKKRLENLFDKLQSIS